jgi:hypothetical protein
MLPPHRSRNEVQRSRYDLAALAMDVGIVRLGFALSRKYREDQPRQPAGQPEGGQWVSEGGDGGVGSLGDEPETTGTTESGVTDDGSRVLSIRVRDRRSGEWNEDHAVEAPDGTRFFFRTDGSIQSIYGGDSETLIARSVWTDRGPEPEAIAEPAFLRTPLPALPGLAPALPSPTPSALRLYEFLAGRNAPGRTAVIGFSAREFAPAQSGAETSPRVTWVGTLTRTEVNEACPRHEEVQSRPDAAAETVRQLGGYPNAAVYGTRVHTNLHGQITSLKDPDFRSEVSLMKSAREATYGRSGRYGSTSSKICGTGPCASTTSRPGDHR